MQAAIGVERQLPFSTTVAATFTNTHAIHLLRSRNINAPLDGTYDSSLPNSGVRPYGNAGNILLYESSGVMDQNQFMVNINSRVNRSISVGAYYVLGYTNSNTDSASSFPADQYDLSREWGRSLIDTRHRFVMFGSVAAPLGLRFSPFIIARSGNPFNITVGRDLNGDTLINDRPGLATNLNKPGVVVTPWGALDPNPTADETIIPRNYGEGPGSFTVNMRLSRTFGFGPSRSGRPSGGGMSSGGSSSGGSHHDHGSSGMRMGSSSMHGLSSGETSDHRYNVTLSVSARNLFNHVNPGQYIGNMSSPLFGQSNSIGGGYDHYGSGANNRRIDFQLRFSF
jgi:hypothetical protein